MYVVVFLSGIEGFAFFFLPKSAQEVLSEHCNLLFSLLLAFPTSLFISKTRRSDPYQAKF